VEKPPDKKAKNNNEVHSRPRKEGMGVDVSFVEKG
jgi:hypothetical protein